MKSKYITTGLGRSRLSDFTGTNIIHNLVVSSSFVENTNYRTASTVPIYVDLLIETPQRKNHYLCFRKLIDNGELTDLLTTNFNVLIDADKNNLIINVYSPITYITPVGNLCITVNYESI